MSENRKCGCPCHCVELGNMEATRHAGNFLRAFHFAQRARDARSWGVDRMDPIEAVLACRSCSGLHAEVLSGRPTFKLLPPPKPKPPAYDHGEGAED